MSDYATKATSIFEVNGTQAKEELTRLKKHAEDVREALMQAWKTGDTTAQKGLQKELNKTEKQIRKIQSEIVNVEQVLKRLDKATPKELQQTLRRLEKDLKNIERGSSAWDEQTRKIKAVRTELAKIKAETKEQSNLWDRFAKKMFDWGAAIQTTMAAITGITMTARQAVQAYADMEGEMASVRKFTGMTADEVERLNEEFKKIDTRTSREDLNKLAQEAGRLGLQSQEDVLGFVRAADQINVALDDLGEGATLTLSKLTDIFGDKQRLGVEQSLLSVGSVINELSQNCSASAPYLAEFASRLGGVGAQAGMSIQQIMAFGAVLDSAQQNVESSATALSQLIVKLYRDPAKYAAAAGLEVKAFANLMKKDANEAVLLLLDTLNKAGGMDVLAPMFADMGEKGSRSVQTLSVLANKIDDVRKQQMAANQAFEEGTSVTNEFNVQNNTVQAGLDKAKKSFNEMAVELGQKLAPLMRYAITSGSALLKVMSTTITFVSRHKKLLLELALVMVMFNAQLVATVIQTKALATWQAICTVATKMWSAAVTVGTAAVTAFRYTIGLAAVAYIALTKGMTAARIAMAALNATLAISPMGAIVAIAAAAALAISKFRNSLKSAREEAEQARIAKEKYKKSLVDFTNQATESANKEMAALSSLYSVATSDVYTREKRIEAVQKLQRLYPVYFSHLSQEAIMAGRAATEYKALVSAIYDTAMARAAAAKIEQNAGEILDLELKRDQQMDDLRQKDAAARQARAKVSLARTARDFKQAQKESGAADAAATEASLAVGKTGMEIANRNRANQAILKKVPKAADYLTGGNTASTAPSVPYSGSTGGGVGHKNGRSSETKAQTDKLAAEKAWREKEIALAKIAWLKGETDYEQHTDRMEQIEVEYYDRILARADLSEQERLEAQGKSLEAQKKQKETAHARTIEQENQQYAELQAVLQNDYLQGRISRKPLKKW